MKGVYEVYGNEANGVPGFATFVRNLGSVDPERTRVAEDRVHKIIFETFVSKAISFLEVTVQHCRSSRVSLVFQLSF